MSLSHAGSSFYPSWWNATKMILPATGSSMWLWFTKGFFSLLYDDKFCSCFLLFSPQLLLFSAISSLDCFLEDFVGMEKESRDDSVLDECIFSSDASIYCNLSLVWCDWVMGRVMCHGFEQHSMRGLVATHGIRFCKNTGNGCNYYEDTGNWCDCSKDTGIMVFGLIKVGLGLIVTKTL